MDPFPRLPSVGMTDVACVLLTTREAATLAGVTPASWRSYVSRGDAPQPDGRLGVTPWWRESTIRRWQKSRPGQGAGGGRPAN